MGTNNPFSGQQSEFFPVSSSCNSAQPLPFGQRSRGTGQSLPFGQSSRGTGQFPVLAQHSGLSQTPSGQNLDFEESTNFGQSSVFTQHSELGQGTLYVASSPPVDSLSTGNQGYSFKSSILGNIPAASNLGVRSGETQLGSNVNFEPLERAIFKPIFGACSEAEKPFSQTNQVSFNFSKPVSSGSGGLAPVSFSQFTSNSSTSTSFSFSKPAPCGSQSGTFVFTLPTEKGEEEKQDSKPFFASTSSSFTNFSSSGPLSFRESLQASKTSHWGNEETAAGGASNEPSQNLAKGTKRKEKLSPATSRKERCIVESDSVSRSNYQPVKRSVRLSRPIRGGGLFGRTLKDVLKSNIEGGRFEKRERWKQEVSCESGEPEPTMLGPNQLTAPTLRAVMVREEEAQKNPKRDLPGKISLRQRQRRESMNNLEGSVPKKITTIQVKDIPEQLNQCSKVEKYFSRFGKVRRIFHREKKNLAIIHFCNHESAVQAKKKGKGFDKNITIFFQKKKTSSDKKGERMEEKREGNQISEGQSYQRSPLCKPLIRHAASTSSNLITKGSPHKKPGITKLFQVVTDPFDSGLEGLSSDTLGQAVPSSLNNLIGMLAETAEEKYRLLDQRDKIMRQARVKRTELGRAKVFVGTCPDMCPEKERFMREIRNQLSLFELLPGTNMVDHAAAIKEYSRSSADQEEPLPHELRPSAVLSMTMDYLATKILDQGEGNYREWYDFVWNRTRGIRKDITQQHLCDPVTVSMIEKCTRFHIHCAHHLCEEPISSFEAKINNENMTKCLQSLKEMYQDLANKDIYCPSEAEFRGYSVLLNLNNGDILREVQQFHSTIRNSPEVRFAVQAFAALNSNNFVHFFRLVKAASYLSACILHCYFNQVRRDALKALNFAYTISNQRSTAFPLESLERMLLFQDLEEATDFIMSYGLSISEGYVELNRTSFLEPEGFCKPRKSLLIEQKRTISIGEVINGGPLPQVPQHIPVCSFNSQNKYIGDNPAVESSHAYTKINLEMSGESIEERDFGLDKSVVKALPQSTALGSIFIPQPLISQVLPEAAHPVTKELPSTSSPLIADYAAPAPPGVPSIAIEIPAVSGMVQLQLPPPKPVPAYNNEDIDALVEEIMQETLKEQYGEISRTGAAYILAAKSVSITLSEELLASIIEEILGHLVTEQAVEERRRLEEERCKIEEARLRKERELLITQLSEVLCSELTEEVLGENVKATSVKELKHAVDDDHRARIVRCSQEVSTHLMGVFLEEEICKTAKETLQELQYYCKYLQQWREMVAARKKLKRQMRAFPAAPCCVDRREKLKALLPSAAHPLDRERFAKGILHLGHAGNVNVSCSRLSWLREQTVHQMKVQHFYQQLVCNAAWMPLDLPSLITENLPVWQEQVFWKVVLILPDYDENQMDDSSRVLADWLKAKFMGPERPKDVIPNTEDRIQTLALYKSLSIHEERLVPVNICVKVTYGALSDSELDAAETQKEMLGTSALILLLPPREKNQDLGEDDVYWLSALLQLKQLLQAKPFQPILPLVIFLPSLRENAEEAEEVEEGLMLQDLISAKLILDYVIVMIPDSINDMQGTNKVSEAVKWLVSRSPGPLELCCYTLLQYIEDGVYQEFSKPFYHDQAERRQAGLPAQDPSAIIDLYNSVVTFLAEVVSSEKLCDLSWPVTELAGPGGSQFLPHLQWNTPEHLMWLKKAVLSFQIPQLDLPPQGAPWHLVCSMIFQYVSQIPSSPQTLPLLQSQVENLLSRSCALWQERQVLCSREGSLPVQELPWDDVCLLCINHKMQDWKPPRLPLIQGTVTSDKQLYVYFFKEHIKNFQQPLSWEEAQCRTQREKQLVSGSFQQKRSLTSAKYLQQQVSQYIVQEISLNADHSKEQRHNGALDLTQNPSHEELLPGCLSHSLQAEKEENKRFENKLHQWLLGSTIDKSESFGLPLYLPWIFLSAPESGAAVEHGAPTEEPSTSLSQRLQQLKELIKASKEEEMACELHLSTLLDIVDV
ncbi:germinal-center associated nuclear protein isoform X2 [Rhinatrema bivittatum]|uniref:germinal-center associated nuclear protein isoform X2 n=1 Tax=Rhinatrema bivittatum TaxID=194408 RepID=UPI00112D526F|nr:germinal-center associated nuclear protein isoform X2 [Rhinatrema bivittatum]